MGNYAKETTVAVDRSKQEIESMLRRYGATGFAQGWDTIGGQEIAAIQFKMAARQIRMALPLPSRNDFEITHSATGQKRAAAAQDSAYEQARRQRWRALVLVVKAKLEAVECGISTLEREFLADVVLPNGQTVGQFTVPQIESAYATNRMPALLPGVEGA